jgi:hypothetical protein
MSTKRTIEPRSEYIKLNTDTETKQRLQEIAEARGWSLSLLCHEILQTWLNEKSLAWADMVGKEK